MKPCPPTERSVCIAGNCGAVDPSGQAPASNPDSVVRFNRLISDLHDHALWPIVKFARVSVGKRIVYAGCGTSRKRRRFQILGRRTTRIDETHAILRSVVERRTAAALLPLEASRFLVRRPAYDSVSDTPPTQDDLASLQVLAGMIRVIPARGCLVATGVFRRRDADIALRQRWIERAKSSDGKLMAWFSKKCLVIDRLSVRRTKTLRVWNGKPAIPTSMLQVSSHPLARTARRICWVLRYVTALTSASADTKSEKICIGPLAIRGTLDFRT